MPFDRRKESARRASLLHTITGAQRRVEEAKDDLVEWRDRRDDLIREARGLGLSLREIGEATGLHHTAIAKIAKGGSR